MEEKLIELAKIIIEKYNHFDILTGRSFNIFEAGNVGHLETFHTFLLADLLNIEGSHKQEDKFLQIFLKEIGIKDVKLKKPKITPECPIDNNRRIDIVIDDESFIIGIEAKIYSDDRDNQLRDYYNYLSKKNKHFYLFYLTLDGKEPSKKSLGDINDEKIFCISFKNEILNFINKCIIKSVDVPKLRESLMIYKDLLEKLTKINYKREMIEMSEKILNTKENIEATYKLIESYKYTWAKKEYDFWKDLYFEIKKKVSEKWEDGDDLFYSKEGYSAFYKNKEEFLDVNEAIERIEEIRFTNSQNNHLGIAFKRKYREYEIYVALGYLNDDICSWFGIEIKKDNEFLSSKEIKKFLKNKSVHLNFDKEDEISLYNCIDDLIFASKNDLAGRFDLFDTKKYKNKISNLSRKFIDIIEEIDNHL